MGTLINITDNVEELKKLKKKKQSQYYKEFKKKNPNYYKEKNEKNRSENFEKYLFNKTKASAKKENIEFKIKLSDIIIPLICPLLEKTITKNVGNGRLWTNPCIFRVDESKGYIKSNIIITCILANHYRSVSSPKEARMFADNFFKMFGNY